MALFEVLQRFESERCGFECHVTNNVAIPQSLLEALHLGPLGLQQQQQNGSSSGSSSSSSSSSGRSINSELCLFGYKM
jgi:hypothetical protein